MRNKIRYFLYHVKIVVFIIILAYLTFVLFKFFDEGLNVPVPNAIFEIVMYSAWTLSLLFMFQAVKVLVPWKFKQRFLQVFWKPYNPLRQIICICKTGNLYMKIVLTIIAIALCSIALNGIEISGDVDTDTSVSGDVDVSGHVDTDTSVSGDIDVY